MGLSTVSTTETENGECSSRRNLREGRRIKDDEDGVESGVVKLFMSSRVYKRDIV